MQKLKRFNKNKNKLNTQNILISFAVIMGIMMVTIISKSYAIYKLQQDYDVIKNKIGTYSMGDVRVAVLVDGKEASEFPSYETNYKVESIDCTNGVTATFDVENWQINIADMSATSTKCTVSFNSKETNERTPVNMSKTELLGLVEEYQSLAISTVVDAIYPVGSIYISTTDSSIDIVKERFPGTTWVKYSEGKTLVGEGTNTDSKNNSKTFTISENDLNTGVYTTKLTDANLPYHTHDISHTHTTAETTIGSSGTHKHDVISKWSGSSGWPSTSVTGYVFSHTVLHGSSGTMTLNFAQTSNQPVYMNESGAHTHKVPSLSTKAQSTKTSGGTGYEEENITAVNVQDPYTVVYMYKRTA